MCLVGHRTSILASTRIFAVTLLACFLPSVRAACDSYVYLSYIRRGIPLNSISSVSSLLFSLHLLVVSPPQGWLRRTKHRGACYNQPCILYVSSPSPHYHRTNLNQPTPLPSPPRGVPEPLPFTARSSLHPPRLDLHLVRLLQTAQPAGHSSQNQTDTAGKRGRVRKQSARLRFCRW